MKIVNKIADFIDKTVEWVGTGMILFIFVANVLQVVVRKLGGTLSWADEICRHLMLILIFYGAALGARKGSAIRITVLLNRLPEKARKWAELVQYAVVFVFMVVTTYSMYLGCIGLGDQTLGIVTAIKLSWIYWIIFAALVLLDLYLILYMISVFRDGVDTEASIEAEEELFVNASGEEETK